MIRVIEMIIIIGCIIASGIWVTKAVIEQNKQNKQRKG